MNVGGTAKLPMTKLAECCRAAGFSEPKTYLASGNAVFRSDLSEAEIRMALEAQLASYASKPAGVLVRAAAEMAAVAARNPFAGENGSRVVALFTEAGMTQADLDAATGIKDEILRLGQREVFIFFPSGQADSRLRLPAMKAGTARNMNTVEKLAALAR